MSHCFQADVLCLASDLGSLPPEWNLDLKNSIRNKLILTLDFPTVFQFELLSSKKSPNMKLFADSWTKSAFLCPASLPEDITCEQRLGSSISRVTHKPGDEPRKGMDDSVCPSCGHEEMFKRMSENVDFIQTLTHKRPQITRNLVTTQPKTLQSFNSPEEAAKVSSEELLW